MAGFIKRLGVVLLICCLSSATRAQFTDIQIGVNGLTCSQCSRSVEMRLRKLDFVEQVQMDLEHTNGTITVKQNAEANVDKIAKAVQEAGFSLRYLSASFSFNNLEVKTGSCFEYGGNVYQFVKLKPTQLNGKVVLHFVGENFIAKKDLKKWQPFYKKVCEQPSGKLYYVTL